MSKLAIIATLEVQADKRDEALRILLEHRKRCLRDEPGTIEFELLIPGEPSKLMLFEVYADKDALDKHLKGPSFAQAKQELGSSLINMTGIRCSLPEGR